MRPHRHPQPHPPARPPRAPPHPLRAVTLGEPSLQQVRPLVEGAAHPPYVINPRRVAGACDNLAATGCVYPGESAEGGLVAVIDAEFADFVRANERSLLRLGWLLMAGRHAAEDPVQAAPENKLPE